MSGSAAGLPDVREPDPGHHHGPQDGLGKLALGAIGVVFGDIGTSPIYALKESFVGHHPLAVDALHIYGVLSLIFWTMMLIVTVKYVLIVMRADNKGEGGSLALLAMITRKTHGHRWTAGIVLLGVLATALFYGDAIITPAISVLSAVEGLTVVQEGLQPLVIPIAVAILLALFFIQRWGTARVGVIFGPVMLVYFAVLAGLGALNILRHVEIIGIVNPAWAVAFFANDPSLAFFALGSVVLAVTGAEALYADMGHFGRKPISVSWLYCALPCLLLNYMGQGALLLDSPAAAESPFFLLAPEWGRLPLVILATMATIIASQAVISGAFSVTQQAVQLGFLPRLKIMHTSARAAGQIYIPFVNWALLVFVIMLVLGFQSSSNLAAAYGIAVTGTMFITACMIGVLTFSVWRWNPWLAGLATGAFLLVDGAYFASNLTKIPDGGWFPLLIGLIAFTMLTTWATGRRILRTQMREDSMPLKVFIKSCKDSVRRVPGTAVFMAADPEGVPHALLHNMKHNKVLHDRVLILTVLIADVPFVEDERHVEVQNLGDDFWRIILNYGFMQEIDVPADLARVEQCGGPFRMMETSFFLGRQTLIPSKRPGMAIWREKLFAWMIQNSESAMEFFKLPPNRVIELGSQVEI
jgi:KUP system potassium uptake protein